MVFLPTPESDIKKQLHLFQQVYPEPAGQSGLDAVDGQHNPGHRPELLAPGILWPDFDTEELYKAIIYFQKQPRKFGLVPSSDQ